MRITHCPTGCTPWRNHFAAVGCSRLLTGRSPVHFRHPASDVRQALSPVRTSLRVDALIAQAQPFDRSPAHEVLFHNFRGICRTYVAVPNPLWVNDHRWPVLALIQASRFVDADCAAKPSRFGQLLQLRMQFALSIGGARGPGSTFRACVVTDKNMTFKWWQAILLMPSDYRSALAQTFHICPPCPRPHLRE
jgi:hypothetical protein